MGKGSRVRRRLVALVGLVLASALFTAEGFRPAVAIDPLPSVLLTVTVTPPGATVAPGAHQQFTAMGTYSDLTTRDITSQVTWTTSDAAVATVSNAAATKGRATGVAAGGVAITATDPSSTLFGSALLAVAPLPPPPPPTLVGVVVAPPVTQILDGTSVQFTATGTFSNLLTDDITSSVTWTSSDPSVATVSNAVPTKGRATGVSDGTTTITATGAGGVAGTAVLTVTPIVVIPPVTPPGNPPPAAGPGVS
jgi:cysteine synthase